MEQREDAVLFLKEVLNIASVNGRDDEGKVAEYLQKCFQNHGIASFVDRIDGRHANVLAFLEGEDTTTEIWNGHLDTVDYGNLGIWETNPREVVEKNGKIYARGASDMKSGLAAMVYVLCHLPKRPKRSIQFIGTCDEEKGGLGARKILEKEQMKSAEILLISEPSAMDLALAQKGCLWLKVKVKGKTGHGAYPEQGVNAIHFLYEMAKELRVYIEGFGHYLLGDSTLQINQIQGGIVPNMTADNCEAVLDIRMVPSLTADMVLARAEQILQTLKQEKPALDMRFEVMNQRRAIEIAQEEREVQKLRQMIEKRGYQPKPIGINYFTDASILVQNELTQKVLICGPGEPELAHQPNEYVEIRKYLDYIEVLKEYACE